MFKHIGLFEGIGGFSLAASWMGWETIATCEINDFCNKILKHHFPKAQQHYDIKQTDFTIYRGKCDILTGGFPCQPFSIAGKRKGTDDDRHLFPEMLRAIREIQPTWIVGENVRGIISWDGGLVFEQVQADLEAEGYEVQSFILPASGVNAPHKRERVWFVAYSNRNGRQKNTKWKFKGYKTGWEHEQIYLSKNASYSNGNGQQRSNSKHEINTSERGQHALNDIKQVIASNAESIGRSERNRKRINRCGWKTEKYYTKRNYIRNCNKTISGTGIFTNATSKRLQRSLPRNPKLLTESIKKRIITNSNSRRQPCKEHRKTQSGQFAKESISGNWENFPTQSPICSGNDGISDRLDGITFPKWRNESIKAYGNAIVPQVALQIFKAIEQYEKQT